jgi:hypothetical protein
MGYESDSLAEKSKVHWMAVLMAFELGFLKGK